MHTNSIVGTVYKPCLPAVTYKVVKKNGTSSLAKGGKRKSCCTCVRKLKVFHSRLLLVDCLQHVVHV